jgi:hypothetical protein
MLVLKPVIFTLTVIAMTAGCKTRDRDASTVKDIFSTSRRRPVQASEAPYVARIEACTGFFFADDQWKDPHDDSKALL